MSKFSHFLRLLGSNRVVTMSGFVYGVGTSFDLDNVQKNPMISVLQINLYGFAYAIGASAIGSLIPYPFFIPPLLLTSFVLNKIAPQKINFCTE